MTDIQIKLTILSMLLEGEGELKEILNSAKDMYEWVMEGVEEKPSVSVSHLKPVN